MVEITLVRHGQTDWNAARRFQGETDISLNPTGIEQANKLAAILAEDHFDAIYASDLSRASQTASIIADTLGLPVTKDARLREICKGVFEGMVYDEVKEKYPVELQRDHDDPINSRTPGAETVAEVAMRMRAAADEIVARHPGGRILLVSHGLAISTLYCQANRISLSEVYHHIPDNTVPLKIVWGNHN
ncbi:MAG: histidine phosphatase family protein [Anaerolineae bacterium]|nr:histidine phosphatase family protein [Anaerolineae bacterium]